MQAAPVVCKKIFRLYTADHKTHVDHGKITMSDKGKIEITIPPLSRTRRPAAGM